MGLHFYPLVDIGRRYRSVVLIQKSLVVIGRENKKLLKWLEVEGLPKRAWRGRFGPWGMC